VITARIKLDVPRETVVLVTDSERALDNIVEALREDGLYQDHALLSGYPLGDDHRVRFDRGAWISGPCLDETSDVDETPYLDEAPCLDDAE
jgi:hypothetical protein